MTANIISSAPILADTVTGSKTVNCCKALNPLRRDGTSQSQRFPAPLGEDYVKIDERSIADILNFTQRLAKEFNYVNGGNSADGTWVEFFQEDLSFLLASIAAVDLEEYRTRFLDAYEDATVAQAILDAFLEDNPTGDPLAEAEYATLASALDALFQSFLVSFTSPTTGLTLQPLPQLLDEWYELLPSSAYFGDGSSAYSFQDEVKEARARLSNSFKKVNVAHFETTSLLDISTLVGFAWSSLSPYNDLESVWGVSDAPVITPPKYYTSNATTNINTDGTGKVLDLLKVVFDAFYGMFASLQSRIPDFLTQSLEEYPYHAPQNGLFLAFVNLFTHAQAHINLIGRKHLLYYYQDVLRFSERDLVPDQAILIFTLRKGVTEHLIAQGKLLNAGKDADGKPLYYEVSEETVITPATIAEIRTVYVERDTADATNPNVPIGIYAAPIAKSSDGQGADLDPDEPKWYPFGKAQYDLDESSRTMADAELGWAIGSPIFMMKEGLREVYLSYTLDRISTDTDAAQFAKDYPYAIELLSDPKKRAAAEASLREGLAASYTSLKGWAEASVAEVIIARATADFSTHTTLGTNYGITSSALGIPAGGSTPTKYVLAIKVVLDETAPAFSQFNAAVHADTFATEWPLLKLSFTGSSKCYEGLGLAAITTATTTSMTFPTGSSVALWEGNAYKQSGATGTLIEDYAATLTTLAALPTNPPFVEWASTKTFASGAKALFEGGLYTALASITANTVEALTEPDESSLWEIIDDNCCLYRYLEKAVIEKINIKVKVTGAVGLVLENDNGKVKATKPFQPWTAIPVIGSRFYIGSKEIFGKQLDSLSINILWQDPPPDFAAYYDGYTSVLEDRYGGDLANSSIAMDDSLGDLQLEENDLQLLDRIFVDIRNDDLEAADGVGVDDSLEPAPIEIENTHWQAAIDFLHNGTWRFMETRSIFSAVDATDQLSIALVASEFLTFERDTDLSEVSTLESNTPRGFIRMELVSPNIAFGHKHYRDLYTDYITDKVDVIVNNGDLNALGPAPKEPYTPVIKEFKLDYTSKVSIDLLDTSSLGYKTRVEQFFHVHPFGQTEEHAYLAASAPIALLPQLPEAGHLYLGVSDLTPPSTLSVLFQLAEGSADPDLDRYAPVWSLLSENKWVDLLTSEIPSDSTEELIASGIIKFVLDKDATDANTLLPAGYHWLRGTVAQNTAAIHQALDIIAQAVPVSFYNQNNNTAHLLSAMPSGTITGLKINESAVKKVNQPYASFGGRPTEQDDAFLTRVSERLRHKYRAVNIWDYERMVLEEFPSIYKAKCLNHTQVKSANADGGDWEIAPGYVTLVTIPDLRNVNAVNPFEPKTPLHVLDDVADFLSSYVSAWVDLKVTNPEYEQIEISCSIGLVSGKDPGYYISALEEEIKQFLSPWAFDQTVDIVFGGKIHRSQIIHFIEQRDYVDFVVNFRMDQTIADGTRLENVEEALASTSRSILVSALTHTISSIQAAEVNCATSDDTGNRTGEDCCTCTDC